MINKNYLFDEKYSKRKGALILFLTAICLLLMFEVNFENRIDLVYTHFFYLPVILAALWYGRSSLILAINLGALHVYTNYLIIGSLTPPSICRAIFFVIVATIVYRIAKIQNASHPPIQYSTECDPSNQRNSLGNMVVAIGHEIRNPMTTVRGYLQLLQNHEAFYEHQELFSIIIDDIDKANATLHKCMSLSPQKCLDLKLLNLNILIKECYVDIRKYAQKSGIELIEALEPIPLLMLEHDEIDQLLHNLLLNGVEAMSAGGSLRIETKSTRKSVILLVKDQGPGISEAILSDLGRPFVTNKESHAGLGLAICYSIASRHQAVIHIETSPHGTSMYVTFPIPDTYSKELPLAKSI